MWLFELIKLKFIVLAMPRLREVACPLFTGVSGLSLI